MSKVILITGSTDGIGLLTAQKLAAKGHKILLHGRDRVKLADAAAKVGDIAESYVANFSRLADVEAMATDILAKHDRLDVLINNAGAYKTPQALTAEGLDSRFVVNTFAPHRLTQRLLAIIPNDGRVVNLSSAAQAQVDLQAMAGRGTLADFDAYAQSKLALTIWSREMAAKQPQGPVFIAVNPGSLLASKMVKEGFGVAGHDLNIGADILIKAALSPDFATASGQYFDNDAGQFSRPHAAAANTDHVAAVMAAIEQIMRSVL